MTLKPSSHGASSRKSLLLSLLKITLVSTAPEPVPLPTLEEWKSLPIDPILSVRHFPLFLKQIHRIIYEKLPRYIKPTDHLHIHNGMKNLTGKNTGSVYGTDCNTSIPTLIYGNTYLFLNIWVSFIQQSSCHQEGIQDGNYYVYLQFVKTNKTKQKTWVS